MEVKVAEIQNEVIDKSAVREKILDFESELRKVDGAFIGDNELCPLNHKFSDGIYVREMFLPKGMTIVGKIHKHEHPYFLLKGEVTVVTEHEGKQIIKAPCSMTSPAGTKRVIYANEDTVWITVHHNPDNHTDLKKLEEIIIAENYLEYERSIEEAVEIKKYLNKKNEAPTNCGLVALGNFNDLKNISARTLIDMAEDNGLKLYPYKVSVDQLHLIPFPAIIHSENHFDYVDTKENLKDDASYTGSVLLTQETDYEEIKKDALREITGSSFISTGAIIAYVGLAGTIAGGSMKGAQAKNQRNAEKRKILVGEAVAARRKAEEEKQKAIQKKNNIIIGVSIGFLALGTIIFLATNKSSNPATNVKQLT